MKALIFCLLALTATSAFADCPPGTYPGTGNCSGPGFPTPTPHPPLPRPHR